MKDFLSSAGVLSGSAAATIDELTTKKIDVVNMVSLPDPVTTLPEKQRVPRLSSHIGNPGMLQPTVRDCRVNRRLTVNE